jgi:hypothetical protein
MAGRPPKYETAEELQNAIDLYWELLDKDKPTITGLALALGFESRQSFYDYEKDGEFSYTIKKARLKVEAVYESNLHGGAAAGSIFALKNFGWTDKQEIEHSGPISIKVVYEGTDSKTPEATS